MNAIALTLLVVCVPPYDHYSPYHNYYSHPCVCTIAPGVVCAGGQCQTCLPSGLPSAYGSQVYNYRIAFDYPWSQHRIYSPAMFGPPPAGPEEIYPSSDGVELESKRPPAKPQGAQAAARRAAPRPQTHAMMPAGRIRR